MKKKDFASLILGTVGGLLFALGMCMGLIPEWDARKPGIAVGVVGLAVLLIMVIVRRRMDGKPAITFNKKAIGTAALGIIGALFLGIGMCLVMVSGLMVQGIVVGIIGIVLLCLDPLVGHHAPYHQRFYRGDHRVFAGQPAQ